MFLRFGNCGLFYRFQAETAAFRWLEPLLTGGCSAWVRSAPFSGWLQPVLWARRWHAGRFSPYRPSGHPMPIVGATLWVAPCLKGCGFVLSSCHCSQMLGQLAQTGVPAGFRLLPRAHEQIQRWGRLGGSHACLPCSIIVLSPWLALHPL